jgi:cyclophilin family peptidyl-prolyl cis-trans isomerase
VCLATDAGEVWVTLFPEEAPKAVENFVGLCKRGYYDKCLFFRVIADFMVQTGDPTNSGTGGESIWGREFEDEISPARRFDGPGVLGMANAGPRTNGSQFFITAAATPFLNGKHTVFGRVTKGLDVVLGCVWWRFGVGMGGVRPSVCDGARHPPPRARLLTPFPPPPPPSHAQHFKAEDESQKRPAPGRAPAHPQHALRVIL